MDNIREIIEKARFSPTKARYKIYIIDEVHMLSKWAFNALLKDFGGTRKAYKIYSSYYRDS